MELFKPSKAWEHYTPIFKSGSAYKNTPSHEEKEKQCIEFEKTLKNTSIRELDVKRFIQDNEYYHIPLSLLDFYNFGHHDAYVFKEFPLGNKYKVDYLLIGKSSDGFQFVFVECESIYGSVTLDNGDFGEVIRKGLNQINDWKPFIESNWQIIYSELLSRKNDDVDSLPTEFTLYDSSRMNFMVIAGKRNDYKVKTRRQTRDYEKHQNIIITHYDRWQETALKVANNNSTY